MLLALAISIFIWGVAQGSTDIRASFDIPVEIHGVEESLVVTDQSADEVNVGVMGSRAALNNLDSSRITYEIDVSKVKPGVAEFEVELASIELPRRARFVSHSPSRIQIRLERRSRREVSVVANIEGAPAEGFAVAEVRVVPERVWLAGAKSHVMRVAEVQTEPIDISDLNESQERQARLILGGGTVWAEEDKPVTVLIVVEASQPPGVLDGVSGPAAEEEARPLPGAGGRVEE